MVNAVALRILIMLAVTAEGSILHSRKNVSLPRHNISADYLEKSSMRRYDSYHYEKKLNTSSYEICETMECKTVANEFLSSMNKSIDPCNDFYEFACGKWTTESPIPASSPNWSRFTVFETAMKYRLKEIFETTPMQSDILPLSQAKKWYRSCMDAERLEQRSIQPINSILMQIGGWPLAIDAEEWDEEVTWQSIDRHYASLGGSYTFFELESGYRPNDAEFGKISILPSELPLFKKLPRIYRDHTSGNYEGYVRLIEEVVHLFIEHNRAAISKQRVRKEIEDLVEFEKEIDKLKRTPGHSNSLTFNDFIAYYNSNMTDMSENSKTKIDWTSVIQNLFGMVNIVVDPSAIIHVSNTAYIQGIPVLLKRTPLRTIVNYIHWKFVGNMLAYTTEKMRNRFLLPMLEEMFGVKERPPRWSECVDDMKMTHAAAYAFVEKYFSESTKNAGLKMAYDIRAELGANINDSNWLDIDSKIFIIGKLNAMKLLLGYPDWYKDKLAVINHYKGLIIGSEYFDNIFNYVKYERKQELKRHVIKIVKVPPWYMDPITVNAMYGPKENTLNMPAVAFQSPLFTEGLPNSVNWGVVGVLIGHEMSHAFDDCAILFGDDGTHTALSEDTLKSYYERAECFVTQFNEYYGKKVPLVKRPWNCKGPKESEGEKTAPENIADTTGLRAVYQAYKKAFDKKSHTEKRLPGLEEFTDDQLFFISFAELWCEVDTPRFTEITKRVKDVHSPGRIRVVGALSNTKDFAKTFDCPIDSPMNSRKTCDIWTTPDARPKAPTETESTHS